MFFVFFYFTVLLDEQPLCIISILVVWINSIIVYQKKYCCSFVSSLEISSKTVRILALNFYRQSIEISIFSSILIVKNICITLSFFALYTILFFILYTPFLFALYTLIFALYISPSLYSTQTSTLLSTDSSSLH